MIQPAKGRGMRCARGVVSALLFVLAGIAGAQKPDTRFDRSLNEWMYAVPVTTAAGEEREIIATSFHPDGEGPFPLIVLNHGSPVSGEARANMGRWRRLPQVREFVERGFAVVIPMRRGYGQSGGEWAESYGGCSDPDYYAAGKEAARDILATVARMIERPYVKRDQIIFVGQSAGGIAAIAAASEKPPGLLAVVNFSGGRGGTPKTRPGEPCSPVAMAEAIARFAKTITVPVLWHYVENDKYFSPEHVRGWFAAFEHAGGTGRLVMQPRFGNDGHSLFASIRGIPIWTREFDRFLAEIGLAR
jgi:dienelactone hydrolase